MLKKIYLEDFKCFQKLDISIGPLTLLTGCNSSGKSTIIQSIAMLKQTLEFIDNPKYFILNGDEIHLGDFGDIQNYTTGRGEFKIGLMTSEDTSINWSLAKDDSKPRIANIESITLDGNKFYQKNSNENQTSAISEKFILSTNFIKKIQRLSSERIGPQDIYPVPDQYNSGVGSDGQFTPFYINEKKNTKISSGKRAPTDNNNYLTILNEEINNFFPNYRVDVSDIEGTDAIKMRFSDILLGRDIKPRHVGFGVSHVLPILALGLGAGKGDTIIIENPELHLHPKAQSQLSYFLSKVVSDGIQVIIETHSDHIINGFRKSIKNEVIPPSSLSTYYFKQNLNISSDVSKQVENLEINDEGNFSSWPDGFFDQLEKDMEQLLGW